MGSESHLTLLFHASLGAPSHLHSHGGCAHAGCPPMHSCPRDTAEGKLAEEKHGLTAVSYMCCGAVAMG